MFTRNRVIISDLFQDHEKYLNTTINVCGWAHLIRDVIPYPRYPKHCNQ